MNYKIKTPANFSQDDITPEKNSLPSMTIPGQAMSIKEIMRRFQSGLPIEGARVPMYYEDDNGNPMDIPDMKKLDLSERFDLIDENRDRINKLKSELENPAPAKVQKPAPPEEEEEEEPEQKPAKKKKQGGSGSAAEAAG